MAVPSFAWGAEPPAPIAIDYGAPDGCPDPQAFEAQVRGHLSSLRFAPGAGDGRTFEVRIEAGPPFVGRMTVRRAGVVEGSREIRADTCATVAETLALVVALAVDPDSVDAPDGAASAPLPIAPIHPAGPAPELPETPSPPSPASPPASPPVPRPLPQPRPGPPPHRTRDGQSRRSLPRAKPAFSLYAGADIVAATGASPKAAWGASPYVGWAGAGAIAPSVRLAVFRTLNSDIRVTGGNASFTWSGARLDGCVAVTTGSARWLGCTRLEAGTLEGAGSAIVNAHSAVRRWVAAGPLARAQWSFAPPLFADAEVGAMARVTVDRFYFLPDTTIYHVPFLGWVAGLGMGVRFW